MACLPDPYKLSMLGDIWWATFFPFSSSKYFFSYLRLKFSWSFIWISYSFPVLSRFCNCLLPAISSEQVSRKSRGCSRIARVTPPLELGTCTMSKNNLTWIALSKGPLCGIHSLTLITAELLRAEDERTVTYQSQKVWLSVRAYVRTPNAIPWKITEQHHYHRYFFGIGHPCYD